MSEPVLQLSTAGTPQVGAEVRTAAAGTALPQAGRAGL